jgi:hypothetical protein
MALGSRQVSPILAVSDKGSATSVLYEIETAPSGVVIILAEEVVRGLRVAIVRRKMVRVAILYLR